MQYTIGALAGIAMMLFALQGERAVDVVPMCTIILVGGYGVAKIIEWVVNDIILER